MGGGGGGGGGGVQGQKIMLFYLLSGDPPIFLVSKMGSMTSQFWTVDILWIVWKKANFHKR